MKEIIKVRLDKLTENPVNALIYTISNLEDLVESIKVRGLQEPIIINADYVTMSGHRRVAASRLLNFVEIDAIIDNTVETNESGLFLIHSNKHRIKTAEEKYNEIKYLRDYYGNRQGFRSDLQKTSGSPAIGGQKTRDIIAKELGISPTETRQLEKIAQINHGLLSKVGKDATLNQIFQQVDREEKRMKATEEISRSLNGLKKSCPDFEPKIYNKSSIKLDEIQSASVNCIISSPPYFSCRIYSDDPNELGREATPELYLDRLAEHFKDCYRVLAKDGSMFIVIADTFVNMDLQLIPARLAIKIKEMGFILRNEIVWRKTTSLYRGDNSNFTAETERILFFTKSRKYKYREVTVPCKTAQTEKPGSSMKIYHHKNTDGTTRIGSPINPSSTDKNLRDFWTLDVIETASCNQKSKYLPKNSEHPAPFPIELPNILIAKTTDPGDLVLDIFAGSCTVGESALLSGCRFIGYELIYAKMCEYRLLKCYQDINSKKSKRMEFKKVRKQNYREMVVA
jgi:DNA modification methylase